MKKICTMKTITIILLVVLTGCYAPRFQKDQAVCVNGSSGFRIDQFVCTANHVATEDFAVIKDQFRKEEIGIVVARDTVNDIALIKVKDPKFYDYTVGTPRTKDKVNTIANPIGLEFSEISGEVQNVDRMDNEGTHLIQIGIDVYFGSSGAAVYNNRGQFIGMIVQVIPGTRFTFIVPAYHIVALIKRTK